MQSHQLAFRTAEETTYESPRASKSPRRYSLAQAPSPSPSHFSSSSPQITRQGTTAALKSPRVAALQQNPSHSSSPQTSSSPSAASRRRSVMIPTTASRGSPSPAPKPPVPTRKVWKIYLESNLIGWLNPKTFWLSLPSLLHLHDRRWRHQPHRLQQRNKRVR